MITTQTTVRPRIKPMNQLVAEMVAELQAVKASNEALLLEVSNLKQEVITSREAQNTLNSLYSQAQSLNNPLPESVLNVPNTTE